MQTKITKTIFGLGFLLVVALGCTFNASTAKSNSPNSGIANRREGGSLYKFKEAGIQFIVPAGWQVEKDKDGSITVAKQEGDNFVLFLFSLAPPEVLQLTSEQQFNALSEGILSAAKKDFVGLKLAESKKDTRNGIPITAQRFEGKQKGVDMIGVLALLSTNKPVFLYVQGTAKLSENLEHGFGELLESIKKIE